MEQAIAVGALGVQVIEKVFAGGEGGAQRLVKRMHARRLGKGRAGSLAKKRRLPVHGRCLRACSKSHELEQCKA
ncbi:hypothetical protein Pstr01_34580 [Pseudomonas straminea]|nr:hypothetical protein Pstr01_34580 [Pseudomonas straminea]